MVSMRDASFFSCCAVALVTTEIRRTSRRIYASRARLGSMYPTSQVLPSDSPRAGITHTVWCVSQQMLRQCDGVNEDGLRKIDTGRVFSATTLSASGDSRTAGFPSLKSSKSSPRRHCFDAHVEPAFSLRPSFAGTCVAAGAPPASPSETPCVGRHAGSRMRMRCRNCSKRSRSTQFSSEEDP
jgi:hypothetical protein